VYPGPSSQNSQRIIERRCKPRIKSSSLIYAQIGSVNGGIVVNLGMDGVACHAAQKLSAENISTLNLRLRGSGLSVELDGELVWLGETKKEIGIRFKSPSSAALKDIAEWMARESQPPASAALALSRESPAEITSDAQVGASANDTSLPAISELPDLSTGIPAATPLLESTSALEDRDNFVELPKVGVQEDSTNSSTAVEQAQVEEPQVEQLLPAPQSSVTPSFDTTARSLPSDLPVKTFSEESRSSLRSDSPQVSAKPLGKKELSEKTKNDAVPPNRVSRRPWGLPDASALLQWIPPALFAAWSRVNARQKMLIRYAGAGFVGGVFALVLILTVLHTQGAVHGAPDATSEVATPQPPAAAEAPLAAAGASQASPTQGPAAAGAPPASTTSQSDEPQDSVFSNISNFLGRKPDPGPKITDGQLPVPVWTSQTSGYYYCANDPYALSMQPAESMTQGEALLKGYRPRAGQFCN
jgi:hypothetical protein